MISDKFWQCVVVRIFVCLERCYGVTMVSNSRDLQFYAQWCARLADECDTPAVADKLRHMSRDLIVKAQNEARLHNEKRLNNNAA